MKLSPAELANCLQSLTRQLSCDVLTQAFHRALYSTDASLYQIQPVAVVIPKTWEDVSKTIAVAAEHGIPLLPRGGGTSLSGQTVGPGIVIDFSKHLNRIIELDPDQATARVQPGVVLDQLNAAAAKHGLQFGPDVATSNRANLGGMIGNNSAGSRSIVHGKTVDHVIELDVLLADGSAARLGPLTASQLVEKQRGDGRKANIYRQIERIVTANRDEIIARFPKVLRRVGGYNLDEFVPEFRGLVTTPPSVARLRDVERSRFPESVFNLAKLVVGSEGTLATVTEALVHLVPLPKSRAIAVLHFEHVDAACAALAKILPLRPSAAEFLDGLIVRMARNSLEYRNYLDFVVGDPASLILVEFSGESDAAMQAQLNELTDKLQGVEGLYHILPAIEPKLLDHVWACRKAGLPLLMGIPGLRKPVAFVEDTAVDPAKLQTFVRRFQEVIATAGTEGAIYGHASVGCLHIRPLINPGDHDDLRRMREVLDAVADLVAEFGGAMSGEHGDGLARSFLNERMFGPQLYQAFRDVKAAFDPANLMNPGKIVDAPGPTENMRQGADYTPLKVPTTLDFSREGGMAAVAELCNGAGVCRKTNAGTMCPSFMATRDEEHSTRGRANALRLVLSGALPREELTGKKMFDTYDLCLQCKGCKAECPSNVDVAKLKIEFLDHYHQEHGVPQHVRIMANVHRLNKWGSRLAPVSNWLAKLPGAAWMLERSLGLDRRRPLPNFHRRSFSKWFAQHKKHQSRASNASEAFSRGKVVLLDDCLTGHCEPHVNIAAVRVLEACGYEVIPAGLLCCGRTMLSQGMPREAKQLAAENIKQLLPHVDAGRLIVGCEPSCLLTLADDYLDLMPGEDARRVAAACSLLETFLRRAMGDILPEQDGVRTAPDANSTESATISAPRDKPLWQPANSADDVLLHGHCHQRALVGMDDAVSLLTSAGANVQLLDSGCCGMAGSFGYEHYDISMAIGERVLLPAVRDAAAETRILTAGFSCRHQIAHGAKRTALHPVQYLAEKVVTSNQL
ncbi:MAG: FAD-binding protein [Pirellulales bacterium]|nr:FAD-binding protein [Pirellulales bacterium]